MQTAINSVNKRILFYLHDRTVIFLVLALFLYLAIGEMYHNIHVFYMKEWTIHIRRLAEAMLLALPMLLTKKKTFIFPYLLLVTCYILSIVLYYRVYCTIMALASYLMVYNLDGLSSSVLHLFEARDLILVLPLVFFCVYYSYVCKNAKWSLFQKTKVIILSVLMSGGIILLYACKRNPSEGYEKLSSFYALEPLRAFKEFGIAHFWIYQINICRGVTQLEKEYATDFMQGVGGGNNCAKQPVEESRNLILILVESFHSWPIGMNVGGIEITPHINQLLKLNKTVPFLKETPQVKDGRSSDAQLIINTGLLPLVTGAASSLCATNTFYSLPEALGKKGYVTASFLCDDKCFWNQEATSIAYHFDQLHDRLIGDGGVEQADEQLFARTLPVLEKLQQPFYAQVVTLSSHHPYWRPHFETPLDNVTLANEEVKNYLIVLQYVDHCIGEFLEKLKEKGLYDNSVIVITGDHDALPLNIYEGREEMKVEDCFVPFIILNSPLSSKHTDKVIAQMDLYPSLLDLMGCSDYAFTGLGESVFCDKISDYATYRTVISAGGTSVPDSVKRYREECWKVSDILLRMNYFKDK